jgi:hypothetical protein
MLRVEGFPSPLSPHQATRRACKIQLLFHHHNSITTLTGNHCRMMKCTNPKPRRSWRSAFTLIELLVVSTRKVGPLGTGWLDPNGTQ